MLADWTSPPFAPNGRANLASPIEIGPAILRAVAYADIFDYPVTVEEIARYLDRPSPVSLVQRELAGGRLISQHLGQSEGFYMLAGRESIVALRRRRGALAQQLWPGAIRFGRLVSRLPFVRMVAVTGSLAMNNPTGSADIDYLVITETGRLWICRAFVIGVVRWAALRGIRLCPNYFLALDSLDLRDRTLYTAREVTQMIPLSGLEVYRLFRRKNEWVDRLLPNAAGRPVQLDLKSRGAFPQPAAEWLLSGAAGRRLERWEMRRKIWKLEGLAGDHSEAGFSAGRCKGHYDAHNGRTMNQFRLKSAAHHLRIDPS